MATPVMNYYKGIQFFPTGKMALVAQKHYQLFVHRVTRRGLDANGVAFKGYSAGYAARLRTDFRTKSGRRYKGYKGVSLNTAKVSKPVFELTGRTMLSMKIVGVRKSGYGFEFKNKPAEIVEGNAKATKKRDIVGFPDNEINFITNLIGKMITQEFNKVPNIQYIRVKG